MDAIKSCGWFTHEEKDVICMDIARELTEDVMLTLILTRLPNIKSLSLPISLDFRLGTGKCLRLFRDVAHAAAERRAVGEQPGAELPFSKLLHIETLEDTDIDFSAGLVFESLLPLMALPSVRTLTSLGKYGGSFDWPNDLPKSRIQEIHLTGYLINAKTMLRWAEGLRGPCVVHQTCWKHEERSGDPSEPSRESSRQWNRFEIPFEDADKENWTMESNGRAVDHIELAEGEDSEWTVGHCLNLVRKMVHVQDQPWRRE